MTSGRLITRALPSGTAGIRPAGGLRRDARDGRPTGARRWVYPLRVRACLPSFPKHIRHLARARLSAADARVLTLIPAYRPCVDSSSEIFTHQALRDRTERGLGRLVPTSSPQNSTHGRYMCTIQVDIPILSPRRQRAILRPTGDAETPSGSTHVSPEGVHANAGRCRSRTTGRSSCSDGCLQPRRRATRGRAPRPPTPKRSAA